MKWIKQIWYRYGWNPLDQALKFYRGQKGVRILVCWNRGLGDIPLGLYAFKKRVEMYSEAPQITFLTRSDLAQGFSLMEGVKVLVDPTWKRYQLFDVTRSLAALGFTSDDFDLIFEKLEPSKTLSWQIGTLTPKLRWDPAWDFLVDRFDLPRGKAIGVHLHSETTYGYEKNWPLEHWNALFSHLKSTPILLFGAQQTTDLTQGSVIDLRGKTDLYEMLSLIKNRCSTLIAPDSGILSMLYYIDASYPLKVVSLWADPRQGVLKQKVSSPNSQLHHIPLQAPQGDLKQLLPQTVLKELYNPTCPLPDLRV